MKKITPWIIYKTWIKSYRNVKCLRKNYSKEFLEEIDILILACIENNSNLVIKILLDLEFVTKNFKRMNKQDARETLEEI